MPEHADKTANVAMEELKKSVHDLNENVVEFKKGAVDRQTVENIFAELLEKSEQAAPGRRGIEPPDGDSEREFGGKKGAELVSLVMSTPASKAAQLVKRPVEDIQALHEVNDQAVLLRAIMEARDEKPVKLQETSFYADTFKPTLQAALNTVNAGEGAEFIPRELSPNLIDRVELALKVFALFPSIPMPTNPFDLPGRPVRRRKLAQGFEQTDDTGQTGAKKIQIASRKVTLEAMKFWGEALISKEAEEDGILAMMGFIQSELVRYMRFDIEDTSVNGDVDAALDSSYEGDDPLLNWDGLRKLAVTIGSSTSDGGGAKCDVSMLRGNRKKMGVYGADPLELAHIVSIAAYIDVLDDDAVLTLDKYGANATILTGELGKVDNVPLIVSEAVSAELETDGSGAGDGATTEAITVYRNGIGTGERRGLTVEVLRELYSEYDQDAVKVSTRRAFVPLFPPETDPIVAVTTNIAS